MITILILATFALTSAVDLAGECKDACEKCTLPESTTGPLWADGSHACAAKSVAVDPWLSGARCKVTTCDMCGTHAQCIKTCEDFINTHSLSTYPNCDTACNEVPGDFKCFLPTVAPEAPADEPMCYPFYECKLSYCSIGSNPTCAARLNIVDPWDCLKGDICKKSTCTKCGNHQDCLTQCGTWNILRASQDEEAADCVMVCRAVEGYKCFEGCLNSNMEDILAVNIDVNSARNNYIQTYGWYILGGILVFIFAAYYRMHRLSKEKHVNLTETDLLLQGYGAVSMA
eukprot:276311_1